MLQEGSQPEDGLSDDVFLSRMGCTRAEFAVMRPWKQQQLRELAKAESAAAAARSDRHSPTRPAFSPQSLLPLIDKICKHARKVGLPGVNRATDVELRLWDEVAAKTVPSGAGPQMWEAALQMAEARWELLLVARGNQPTSNCQNASQYGGLDGHIQSLRQRAGRFGLLTEQHEDRPAYWAVVECTRPGGLRAAFDAGEDLGSVLHYSDAATWPPVSAVNCLHNGETALCKAAWDRHVSLVKALLALGADANLVGQRAHTPLMNAAYKGNAEIVCLLLEQGADASIRCGCCRKSAADWARESERSEFRETILERLQRPAT
jgi:hypothetical protein